jgi:uncharacterized membrane protein
VKLRALLLAVLCVVAAVPGAAAVEVPVPTHDVAVAISVFPPVVSPGETVDVTVSVWNLGNIDDSAKLTVSTRLMGKNITVAKDLWLPIHSSATITKSIGVPMKALAGNYPILAEVQLVPNPGLDAHLSNNAAKAFITVTATPRGPVHDLAVALSVLPSVTTPCSDVQVRVDVWNRGEVNDSGTLTITVNLAGQTQVVTQDLWLPIQGTASITQCVHIRYNVPAGQYPVDATVQLQPDPTLDANPSNNSAEAAIVVIP